MIGLLLSTMRGLRARFPRAYEAVRVFGVRFFPRWLGIFPRPLAREVRAVSQVLHSAKWNMAYGKGQMHERLEAAFADYTGSAHAIAVNTGGMALQMSMRALGLRPGHEVLLQADTCSATASAVMNAGCTPLFSDISRRSFMLSRQSLEEWLGPETKAVIASHMWGNPEDMAMVTEFAAAHNLVVIEDACLALGARSKGRMAGGTGKVGVFSFGCLKPIQAGEGGMIVTDDESLARELRSLRHWGDRTFDYGVRDVTQLAWNGRMSEIVAAVAHEQLRGYPAYLRDLREAVADFSYFLARLDGLELVLGDALSVEDCAFTQIVLRLDASKLGKSKTQLREDLGGKGIATWHANFEPIPGLTFFREERWRPWLPAKGADRVALNYHASFGDCLSVFEISGLGISRSHFLSSAQLRNLKRKLDISMRQKGSA
jgi:dTDP-4-amino-4,6-dideoxygalactose transaminase